MKNIQDFGGKQPFQLIALCKTLAIKIILLLGWKKNLDEEMIETEAEEFFLTLTDQMGFY